MKNILTDTHLGKPVSYKTSYDPALLYTIPRELGRSQLGITNENKPFKGADLWNAYELSWLNNKGKPEIAIVEFIFADNSLNLVESKSFKLYLNAFNQTKFATVDKVLETLEKDLTQAAQGRVTINLLLPGDFHKAQFASLPGLLIDYCDIEVIENHYSPLHLKTGNVETFETLHTNLFRSNCPITEQPDWASVLIRYRGKKINHEGLLAYLISFRTKNEFHEQCVEQIFMDILNYCSPQELTVYARFTRRGGLDINPFRSNFEVLGSVNFRTHRQ